MLSDFYNRSNALQRIANESGTALVALFVKRAAKIAARTLLSFGVPHTAAIRCSFPPSPSTACTTRKSLKQLALGW
ncbi:MAG TPA: hypothetical protein DDW76_36990 [Cyanobacteria bacterium UBA11369]|nr:hypothetical protein [Cyanobacteria bacterium UBA11371]HBE54202.1 hypothetical protein [Cyanobacteria bacterium UBA11369]